MDADVVFVSMGCVPSLESGTENRHERGGLPDVGLCSGVLPGVSGLGPDTGAGDTRGRRSAGSGRRLWVGRFIQWQTSSNITMQLLDPSGVVVGKTVSTNNGEFTFSPVRFETYTLQCVDDGKVIGLERGSQ